MSGATESRENRKAAFHGALQKLREEFPLQHRIESAPAEIRAAYAKILCHWRETGVPPQADIIPKPELEALEALDAVAFEEQGIGCYPFSARDTGIRVNYSGKNVYAMCAVDALAIPRLVRHASRVTARCAVCRCHLAFAVEAHGAVERGHAEGVRVIWQPRQAGGACCESLCQGIRFVCRHCDMPHGVAMLSLPEAAALGHVFFAFQKRLLDHYERL